MNKPFKISGNKKIFLTSKEAEKIEIEREAEKPTQEQIKRSNRDNSKTLHDSIKKFFLIKVNNRLYDFNEDSKNNFAFDVLFLQEGQTILWDASDNIEYEHTKEQAIELIAIGGAFLRALHKAKRADQELIDSGEDLTLPNLKAIEAAQTELKK